VSGHVVGWAFRQELTSTQKLVLVALADNAQDDGKAWPGKATIVKKTGLSRSSVYRSIEQLEEANLLRHGVDDRGIECYWLAVPQWDAESHRGKDRPTVGRLIENPYEPSENQPPTSPPTVKSKLAGSIDSLWATYVAVMKPPPRGQVLHRDDRAILREVVKVADVAEAEIAIRECAASDFHMKRGKHRDRKGGKYKSIGKIFKPRPTKGETWRSRIEWWLEKAAEREAGKTPQYDVNAEFDRIRKEQKDA
jgi:hypothetical protein